MEGVIFLLCKFGSSTAAIRFDDSLIFFGLAVILGTKWSELASKCIRLSYALPGHPNCCLNSQNDFDNMFSLVRAFGVQYVDVSVVVDVIGSAGCSRSTVNVSDLCSAGTVSSVDMDIGVVSSICCREDHEEKLLLSSNWVHGIKEEGQKFEGGADEFRKVLRKYAIEVGFDFKFCKNESKRIIAECKHKDRTGCMWRIKASVEKKNNFFYIRSLNNVHTCGATVRTAKHKRMGSDIVADLIVKKVREKPMISATDIVKYFLDDYGLSISYYHAWLGIERSRNQLFGNHLLSFDQLRWYIDVALSNNPGSKFVLEYVEGTGRFKRLFVAFNACIEGFKYCRPMLFVDGTFLKGRYKGHLLAATAKDGNQGNF